MKKSPKSEPSGFAVFGLRPELLKAVEKLGWIAPSPVQREAIPLALAGHDLVGLAQTGTGKTGAYVLPILEALSKLPPAKPLHPYCVILAPTRELVQQIDLHIKALVDGLPVRSMTVFGGVSDRPQITQLNKGAEIIVATPGRLLDLIGQGWVHFPNVTHCVLDEADRMFDMGFILDLKRILNRMPVVKQNLLFSATMPGEIRALAEEFLYQPREVRIGAEAPPPELSHEIWEIDSTQKNAALDALLGEDYDCVLVFTRTKHRADTLARRLARSGEDVAVLHGNRSQNQRDSAMARFKQGKARVLVATDVASRGLDITGIGLVVNYDTPHDPDDYVHRVGRTARAKRQGHAVTLSAEDETKYIRKIEQLIKQRIARRRQELPPMDAAPSSNSRRAPSEDRYGYAGEEPRRESRREPRNDSRREPRREPRREARPQQQAEAGAQPRTEGRAEGQARPDATPSRQPARRSGSRGGRRRNSGGPPQRGPQR